MVRVDLNRKVLSLKQSPTLAIADRVRSMEADGRSVVKLQTGDPDFDTPPRIIEAAINAMRSGLTHYSNTRGLPELREAIAEKMALENGVRLDPGREILITHGGAHAVFAAVNALVNPGDEVLIPDPCWTPYASAATLAGATPVRVPTVVECSFKLTADDVRGRASSRTRALILNSPANPSGAVLDRAELGAIGEVSRELDTWVVADEVYERLVYDDHTHTSIASLPGMADRTITIGSFSKTYAMTGWRLGYLSAPAGVCDQILKVSQYTVTNVSPFIQSAGLVALTDDDVASAVMQMVETYARRRRRAVDALTSATSIGFVEPAGAFYVLLDASRLGLDGDALALRLIEEEGVALVPGSGFGSAATSHARMTFAAPDDELDEGLRRIVRFAERLTR